MAEAVRTCIAEQELLLLEDMAIVDNPDCRNVIGQAGVHRGSQRHLPQQIQPACTSHGGLSQ